MRGLCSGSCVEESWVGERLAGDELEWAFSWQSKLDRCVYVCYLQSVC